MFKKSILILFIFCTLVSSAWADSQYDGWWFDATRPGSGVSIEIQGDTMFVAAYSYWNGAPVWFTSNQKYNSTEDIYSGRVQIWQNGAMSMLPVNPFPTDGGNGTIKFTSLNDAVVTFQLYWPKTVPPLTINITRFMPTVAPGTTDSRFLGWWYDPAYNGMGFFLEVQGGTLFGAWYHYYPDEQTQTAFGTWLSFGVASIEGSSSFSGNLTLWQGGSGMGDPVYIAPVSTDTGIPFTLDLKADGKIDMHVGGSLNLDLKLERFRFN